jgi:methionyl aminopeptidase
MVGQEKDSSLDQIKKKLLMVTQNALQKAIENIRAGITTTQNIGNTIEKYVHSQGFFVVKEYGGHGIGHEMHQSPFIPNYKIPAELSTVIPKNTAICIEPLVQIDNAEIQLAADN